MTRSKWALFLVLCVVVSGSLAAESKEASQALLAAAAEGDVDAMRQALAKGADPNVEDENGNTPLMMVAVQRLFGGESSIVGELIAKKAKLDGPVSDILHPGRKGAELTLDYSEYGTTVTYHYRTAEGEDRERPVSANVIDVSVYKGDDMVESDVWTDAYPTVYNDLGVLRTTIPLAGIGVTKGQTITVTTEFGKCVSKPTKVTLK